jgi:hypothetical protein
MHAIMEVDELDEDAVKRHVQEELAQQEEEVELEENEQEDESQGTKNKELREQMVQIDLNLRKFFGNVAQNCQFEFRPQSNWT